MKDKYYQPTKEEFHIGFEYEVLQKAPNTNNPNYISMTMLPELTEDTWFKFTYPDPFLGYRVDKLFEHRDIRVKYLDRSDIEDLGFNDKHYDGIQPRDTYFKIKTDDDVYQITVYWNMLRDDRENLVRIYKGKLHNYPYTEVFRGDIKNKSELKVLLKQLNINH